MLTLFNKSTCESILQRIKNLTPESQANWGTMHVAQMFAHMNEAFSVPLKTKEHKSMILGYIFGPFLKKKLVDDSPIKKNIPTVPSFKISEAKHFEVEKNKLLQIVEVFHDQGTEGIGAVVHPFFGKLTAEEWGKGMYKHLNHHLKQFSV